MSIWCSVGLIATTAVGSAILAAAAFGAAFELSGFADWGCWASSLIGVPSCS
jgi:hypothetical protein